MLVYNRTSRKPINELITTLKHEQVFVFVFPHHITINIAIRQYTINSHNKKYENVIIKVSE